MKQKPIQVTAPHNNTDRIPLTTFFGKRWEVEFDEPDLTSDAGLAAVQASGVGERLLASVAEAIEDERRAPTHGVEQIISQRVYGILAGYADANDSDRLRDDPVVRNASGRGVEEPLASQPTVSRLENAARRADIFRMSEALLKFFLDSFEGEAPPMICIDMDPSAHLLYGQQELGIFNTHVGDTCLMPFYVFDGITGRIMAAVLREGTTPRAGEIKAVLSRLVAAIRKRFPTTRVMLRADGHHTKPDVMDWMEAQRGDGGGDEVSRYGVDYVTGLAGNPVLERLFAADIAAARKRCEGGRRATGNASFEQVSYAEAEYAAGSWSKPRRVVARIIAGPLGVDIRYVVTSLEVASPQYVYGTVYCGRGEAELFIRECKQLGSDTSPCTSATANAFRLLLHAIAYAVLHRFREVVLAGTRWARAMLGTIQVQLIKVAARVELRTRKVVLHLGVRHSTEFRGVWRRAAAARASG